MRTVDRVTLLTDADCGFCQRMAGHLPRLRLNVRIRTLQGEDLRELGVDPERALREMAVVLPDGGVRYGAPGWAAALATGARPWRLLAQIMDSPVIRPVAARVYRWVSENRERLPGGTPACRLDSRS